MYKMKYTTRNNNLKKLHRIPSKLVTLRNVKLKKKSKRISKYNNYVSKASYYFHRASLNRKENA